MSLAHRSVARAFAGSLALLLLTPTAAVTQPARADDATAILVPRAPVASPPATGPGPGDSRAQPATDAIERASRGLRLIYVTDNAGLVRACGLVAREPAGLRVLVRDGERLLPWEDIARVHAVGDPVHDGFFKGLLIGGGLAALSVWVGGGEVSGSGVMSAGLVYGLIGMAIDAAHVGTTTLYVAPGMSPARRPGQGSTWRPSAMIVGARFAF